MAETSTEKDERERAEAEKAAKEKADQVEKDMGADEFVVIAPYVTLKVKDQVGSFVIRGFNEGGTVKSEDIDPDNLRHHLETGLLAPVGSDAAKYAGPAGTPKPGEPPNVPVTEQPVTSLPLDERLKRQQAAAAADEKRSAAANKRPAPRQDS
jgi:hypothetical protein